MLGEYALYISVLLDLPNLIYVCVKSIYSCHHQVECQVKLVDSVVQVLSVLADFQSSCFEGRVLNSPAIIVAFSVNAFNSVKFYFTYFKAWLLDVYIYNCFIFLMNRCFYHCEMTLFVSSSILC